MDNQREDFEAWFKTTKWYTGDNCTPKYRTYRSMLQAWQQAQKVAVPDGFVLIERTLITRCIAYITIAECHPSVTDEDIKRMNQDIIQLEEAGEKK